MTSPFQDALREELLQAAHRSVRRRRRGRISAGVAAITAAVGGSLALLWPSPAAADVEVTIRDGIVEVRIVDLITDPGEVREAMDEAGLDAEVVGAPTGPSAVGRFVGVGLLEGDGGQVDPLGSDAYSFDGFRLPEGWEGTLVISVGVPARPGQDYDFGSNALARGEPFACRPLVGRTVAEARAAGDLEGAAVRVGPTMVSMAPVPLDDPAARPYLDWYIAGADATSADSVQLTVQEAPTEEVAPPC